MANVICPVCRSTLSPVGRPDVSAPAMQRIPCPVCTYPIDLASGFPIPYRWTGFNIIQYVKPVVSWQEVQAQAAKSAAAQGKETNINDVPSSDTIYKDFSVVKPVQDILAKAGEITGNTAASALKPLTPWLIGGAVVLLLVVFLNRQK